MDTLTLPCTVEIAAASGAGKKAPRIRILASNGDIVTGCSYWPSMAFDLSGAVDLDRQMPILADHDATLGGIAGYGVGRVVGGARLEVEGAVLEATPAGRQILDLTRAGMALQASVGLQSLQSRYVREGETVQINGRTLTAPAGSLRLVEKWRMREVSVLPVGADTNTSVDVAAKGRVDTTTKEQHMSQSATVVEQTVEAAAALETSRVTGIEARALHYVQASPGRKDAINAAAATAATNGATLAETEVALMRASRPTYTGVYSHGAAEPATPDVLLAGVLRLVGRHDLAEKVGPVAAEESRRFRHSMDLARACLVAEGRTPPSNDREMVRAAFSTNSMSVALGESGNRIALAEIAASPPTIQSIAKAQDVRDFKSVKVLSPVLKHGYAPLAPGGEIQHAALDEELKDSAKADTYAQMFTITHQDMANDDLGVLDAMVVGLARNGGRKLNDIGWALLMANATSYFHTLNHGNLITGATTLLGIGGLTQGIKAFREQTDADGRPLDISPRILSVPPALEATGLQLLASTELARYVTAGTDNMPTANPWTGKLSLLVEPRLGLASYAGASDTAWYLWADSSQSAILISYVGGMRAPTIEQVDAGPNVLGLTYRGYWDFGVSMCEWRAALKSDGA